VSLAITKDFLLSSFFFYFKKLDALGTYLFIDLCWKLFPPLGGSCIFS